MKITPFDLTHLIFWLRIYGIYSRHKEGEVQSKNRYQICNQRPQISRIRVPARFFDSESTEPIPRLKEGQPRVKFDIKFVISDLKLVENEYSLSFLVQNLRNRFRGQEKGRSKVKFDIKFVISDLKLVENKYSHDFWSRIYGTDSGGWEKRRSGGQVEIQG